MKASQIGVSGFCFLSGRSRGTTLILISPLETLAEWFQRLK